MLLVVYIVSQMASTLFMSTTMDKMQRTLMMVLPLLFVTSSSVPDRPAPLLGDDEPVDGRAGAGDAAAVPKTPPRRDAAVAEATATTATAAEGAAAGAEARSRPARHQPPRGRRKKKGGRR